MQGRSSGTAEPVVSPDALDIATDSDKGNKFDYLRVTNIALLALTTLAALSAVSVMALSI